MIKTCEICSKEGKYKCPTCLIHYCSVNCFKTHKENNKCEVATVSKKVDQDGDQPKKENPTRREVKIDETDSTIPQSTLEMLKTNKEVKDLLDNPHLRNLLVTIDESENAEEIMQKAMQEPIFVEFADACLKVVEPKEENGDF
ncbi:unnamed protein product [Phaedon cochleariae]|uniref:Zinc finger HIT domain-containing protein 3 n=1 Tax=Phaedon cochleariae TaxID=80249 RepID=A0A9P0DTU1_PHACE|nr:unnamed protein product [Phaedon cochleariae]